MPDLLARGVSHYFISAVHTDTHPGWPMLRSLLLPLLLLRYKGADDKHKAIRIFSNPRPHTPLTFSRHMHVPYVSIIKPSKTIEKLIPIELNSTPSIHIEGGWWVVYRQQNRSSLLMVYRKLIPYRFTLQKKSPWTGVGGEDQTDG